uniref:RRM domain-containing protein n=2 Tax=Ascaris TaxID=6251 RepID=A0A9J2NZY7_ASCLU
MYSNLALQIFRSGHSTKAVALARASCMARCLSSVKVIVSASRLSVSDIVKGMATAASLPPNKFSVYGNCNKLRIEMFFKRPQRIGNIPYNCSEMDVGNFFSQAGPVVNVRLVYDRDTGRPKGFGFCDFADEISAQGAINTLNGADFNGRALRVNWANK